MKIAICVVTNRLIQPKTALSLLKLVAHTEHETVPIMATEGYTIAENRNYCVIQAIKAGCSHLLFVDDDMTFPPETLDVLLKANKQIVGVNSYSRILPLSTTVGLMDAKGEYMHPELHSAYEMKMPEELFEAHFVGTAVMLIDMKVFEQLEKPWFKFEAMDTGKILIGEDAWLCKKAKEKGIGVWCEPRLRIGHIGSFEYGIN